MTTRSQVYLSKLMQISSPLTIGPRIEYKCSQGWLSIIGKRCHLGCTIHLCQPSGPFANVQLCRHARVQQVVVMQRPRLDQLQSFEHVRTSLFVYGASTLWAKVNREGHSRFMLLCKFGRCAFLQCEIAIRDGEVYGVATARNFAACDTMTECLKGVKSINETAIVVIWPRGQSHCYLQRRFPGVTVRTGATPTTS